MAATMHDVARLAGVSIKTVSNVINDHPHVSEATRAKVDKAIAQLGYQVNLTARNLRRGSTGIVTLALPELKMPYFAELADSVIAEADRLGMRVLVEQTDYDSARELNVLKARRSSMSDGMIYSPVAVSLGELAQVHTDVPMVLLGERIFGSAYDHVTMSNVAAARAATSHLIERGCRRVVALGVHSNDHEGTAVLRLQGYREALAEAGIAPRPELLVEAGFWHRDTGAEQIRATIEAGVDFDGVFAMNDALAIGALRALHEAEVAVPGQVAVIGFDNVDEAAYTSPALSTIEPGRVQIAHEAVRLLLERINEHRAGTSRAPVRRIEADFHVVERASSRLGEPA